jgi:dTDP-4-dehydrorhamnose 3,5-epimerase
MIFEPLAIEGAFRIAIESVADERGFFARAFCKETFAAHGLVAQRSISYNARRGTLRGLHYQDPPHAETKLVQCSRGAVFDVLLDLRPRSQSFRRWLSLPLAAENRAMVYIPAGCAHGFQTLADDTELAYDITPGYNPGLARGIAWNDPALAIPWPIGHPILSAADRQWPRLAELGNIDAAV